MLDYRVNNRGLELINTRSRALCRHEIHEILITDDREASPGRIVDPMSLVCFVEIINGGLILVGDKVTANGEIIGYVAGYDETNFPNHINIILYNSQRLTGLDINIQIGDEVLFLNCDQD